MALSAALYALYKKAAGGRRYLAACCLVLEPIKAMMKKAIRRRIYTLEEDRRGIIRYIHSHLAPSTLWRPPSSYSALYIRSIQEVRGVKYYLSVGCRYT